MGSKEVKTVRIVFAREEAFEPEGALLILPKKNFTTVSRFPLTRD